MHTQVPVIIMLIVSHGCHNILDLRWLPEPLSGMNPTPASGVSQSSVRCGEGCSGEAPTKVWADGVTGASRAPRWNWPILRSRAPTSGIVQLRSEGGSRWFAEKWESETRGPRIELSIVSPIRRPVQSPLCRVCVQKPVQLPLSVGGVSLKIYHIFLVCSQRNIFCFPRVITYYI